MVMVLGFHVHHHGLQLGRLLTVHLSLGRLGTGSLDLHKLCQIFWDPLQSLLQGLGSILWLLDGQAGLPHQPPMGDAGPLDVFSYADRGGASWTVEDLTFCASLQAWGDSPSDGYVGQAHQAAGHLAAVQDHPRAIEEFKADRTASFTLQIVHGCCQDESYQLSEFLEWSWSDAWKICLSEWIHSSLYWAIYIAFLISYCSKSKPLKL